MQLLVEAKADIDAVHPANGSTAFHNTCYFNHPDSAEALALAGCDTTVRNLNGRTGREVAELRGSAAVLARLDAAAEDRMASATAGDVEDDEQESRERPDFLFGAAARDGELDELSRLLDSGHDINALIDAALQGIETKVRVLSLIHI